MALIGSWLPTRLCSDSDTCIDVFLNLSDQNDLNFSDHCNLARAGIELGWCLEAWIIFFNPSFTLSLNPIPTWNLTVVLPLLSEWPTDCTWYSRPLTLWSQPSFIAVLSFFLDTPSNSVQVYPPKSMRSALKLFVSSEEFDTSHFPPFDNLGFFVKFLNSLSYLAYIVT